MRDEEKTKEALIYEVAYLRLLVDDLEGRYRESEDLLKVVMDQYRHITEAVSDYIFSVHLVDGNPVETVHGTACLTITGYSPQEFAENPYLWINMVYEEDRPAVLKHVSNILSGRDVKPLEHRIVRKDGVVRWVRNIPVSQYDAEAKLRAYDGLIRDITERKLAEEALRWSEEKYRFVADFTYDWEHWLGPDGCYIYVSPSCERITGYRPEEFLANPDLVAQIAHPADRDAVTAHYREVLQGSSEVCHLDFRIITRSGEERWISHNCQPVYRRDGSWLGRRGSNRDITHRKRLEDALRRTKRLESVGILTGFKNLLIAILTNIFSAKKQVDPGQEVFESLDRAEKLASHGSDLTQELIVFSRGETTVERTVPIGQLIRGMNVSEMTRGDVRCELSLPDDLWMAEVDEGHMRQVILNIMHNAREAMPEGGVIQISGENIVLNGEEGLPLPVGKYVKVSIKDEGMGIPREHLPRIFDPYFTPGDLESEKGVGLGLAICYYIVKNHDGLITVESEVGVGTSFHIYLPVVTSEFFED